MGKRSRRQQQPAAQAAKRAGPDQLAEPAGRAKPAESRRRAAHMAGAAERRIKQRPPAPWDPFPLAELGIFLGMIVMAAGVFASGQLGKGLLAAGLALVAMGALDTMLREHFNGYRSHAGTLAGMLALLALIVSTAVAKLDIAPRAAIAIGVFVLTFPALRREFVRRSGGRNVL